MAGMIEFVCRLPHLWMDNNLTHFQKAVFPKSEMVFQNPNNGIKFPKKVKMKVNNPYMAYPAKN